MQTDTFQRGYDDRMTGHCADAPLQQPDRREYQRGYRAADREIKRDQVHP